MELYQDSIQDLCKLFIKCKSNFYLYATYCLNKPHSEEVWREYCATSPFFKAIQMNLGLKLPLDSYLLKPVQRISKYQLLLKELNKTCAGTSDKPLVEQALDAMLDVVRSLNDVMHASFIVGFPSSSSSSSLPSQTPPTPTPTLTSTSTSLPQQDIKSLGRLLKRDQLQMTKLKRNASGGNRTSSAAMNVVNRFQINNKSVEVFLFEKAILICKQRKSDELSSTMAASHLNSLYMSQLHHQHHNNNNNNNQHQNAMQLSQSMNNAYSSSTSTLSSISSGGNNGGGQPSSSSSSSSTVSSLGQYFYQFKEQIRTNELGLTENVKSEKKKFEIWTDASSYIFEAASENEKHLWTMLVKSLLETQLNEIKSKCQSMKLVETNQVLTTQSQSFKNNTNKPKLSSTSSIESACMSTTPYHRSSSTSTTSSSASNGSSASAVETTNNHRQSSFDFDMDMGVDFGELIMAAAAAAAAAQPTNKQQYSTTGSGAAAANKVVSVVTHHHHHPHVHYLDTTAATTQSLNNTNAATTNNKNSSSSSTSSPETDDVDELDVDDEDFESDIGLVEQQHSSFVVPSSSASNTTAVTATTPATSKFNSIVDLDKIMSF